ncbi:MAG: HNH endonuclease signature motif containing protein [Carnobacterium sp.]|uniref:HNH endonuclease n=1 Tax=Carnobacterium sp. TaxID=48221 RepID=UPI003315282C
MDLMTTALLKKLHQYILNDEVDKFYRLKVWRVLRLVALRRDDYKCQYDKRLGIVTKADTVHHIIPVRENPRLALRLSNLESISKSNHNREHPEKLEKKKEFTNEERW